MKPPTIVAEIGCNHRGEFSTAQRMIEIIAGYCKEGLGLEQSNADVVVKFQKRSAVDPAWDRPHPNPHHAYGETYAEHRRALEFGLDDHVRLKAVAGECGIGYAASVWDKWAAIDMSTISGRWLKIPSARNTDTELLDHVFDQWYGDVHISVGMIGRREIHELVEWLFQRSVSERTTLYACTSAYPARPEDVCLGEIEWLREEVGSVLAGIGFSGHHHGIAIDMSAVAMGVTHIERHFTLNRTWKGTDHASSLEPDGFRRLVRDAQVVARAMGRKGEHALPCERPHAERLAAV